MLHFLFQTGFHLSIPVIITIITGLYEVIVRAIPTVGDITILGNIIKALAFISNFFNRKK